MIRWLLGVPLLGLAIGLRIPVPLENLPTNPFTTAAVGASIERVQPVLERALGATLDTVPYRIVSPAQITRVLAEEMRLFVGHPRERRAMDRWAEPLSRATSRLLFAKVEMENARINVVPSTFRRLDRMTHGRFEILSPAFRDAVLAHELVHAYQFRRVDAATFFGRSKSLSEFQGPSSVIEGHAQFVARRVAEKLDLTEPFLRLTGLASGDFENRSEESRARRRMSAGLSAFPYYRGHQLVERIVLEHGYEAGMTRLFSVPPRSQMDVTVPARYQPPGAEAKKFARVRKRVARYLTEKSEPGKKLRSPQSRRFWSDDDDRTRTYPEYVTWLWGKYDFKQSVVCSVDFRLAWDELPLDKVAERHRGVIAGVRFSDPRGNALVTLYRCNDEAAARRWHTVTASESESEAGVAWQGGTLVLDLRGDAAGWLKPLMELVQSANKPSPWTGKPRDELPAIFLQASESDEWGLRWRAIRNLGRLDKDAPGARDRLMTALWDSDVEIRREALHALILWEVEHEIDGETLGTLLRDPSRSIRMLALEINRD